jgi:hypothetical protein
LFVGFFAMPGELSQAWSSGWNLGAWESPGRGAAVSPARHKTPANRAFLPWERLASGCEPGHQGRQDRQVPGRGPEDQKPFIYRGFRADDPARSQRGLAALAARPGFARKAWSSCVYYLLSGTCVFSAFCEAPAPDRTRRASSGGRVSQSPRRAEKAHIHRAL